MKKTFIRGMVLTMSLGLITQLIACGTILHPERKGQRSGEIDPKIAVFDAIGLLFFFIPGVVAFAVDFSNGTIYLPHGKRASLTPQEMERITVNGKVNQQELTKLLQEKALISAVVHSEELNTKPLASVDEVNMHLAIAGTQYASK